MSVEFPPLSVAGRDSLLRAALARQLGEDAPTVAIISSSLTIRWLTGFTGSAGLVVVPLDTDRPMHLITDGRYAGQAANQIAASGASCVVAIESSMSAMRVAAARQIATHVGSAGSVRVGFEPNNLVVADFSALEDELRKALGEFGLAFDPRAWTSVESSVAEVRRTKSPDEVLRITRAAAIADAALRDVRHLLVPGISERELRDHLETAMRVRGSDGPSFDTIVAFGPNAALPHHRPSHRLLGQAETVVLDFGAMVDGYHSDMTRSFVSAGPEHLRQPLLERHHAVRRACEAGVARVAPGVRTSDVDAACRAVLAEAGLESELNHGIGHGVGLAIHESPWVNPRSADILRCGDVVTVEPGAYRVGLGGIRVEELLLVTETGHSVLTHSPKDPACPPSPPTI